MGGCVGNGNPARLPVACPSCPPGNWGEQCPQGQVGKRPLFAQAAPECSGTSPGRP